MVSRFHYTPEMLAFLRTGYQEMQIPALTEAFNARLGTRKGNSAIKTACTKRGFTCGRKPGNPKGSYQIFTQEQAEFIRYGYQAHTLEVLTERLNEKFGTAFTLAQVKAFTSRNQVHSGRTGQFVPGQAPPNKGVKGWQAGGRSAETRFKPGRPAHEARNYQPIGSVRFTREGYMERKVTDDPSRAPARRWVAESRVVWEAANGPIPDGHVVVFLDGDRLNCALDNLRCVPRSVLTWINKTGLNDTAGEARKAAIQNAQERLRDYLRFNMEASGVTKITSPLFAITLVAGRDVVVVDDENALPDEFVRVKTTIAPDKVAILAALKEGQDIPGAHIGKSQSSVRIK